MASFSTLEALQTLCRSIPDWIARLHELNGQIALRQIELARLEESERPPTRSVKHKGSTESLRPNDQQENPFLSNDTDDIQLNPFDTPKSNLKSSSPTPHPSSPPALAAVETTSDPTSKPRSPGNVLSRHSSQATPNNMRSSPAVLRKRKTGTLASGESNVPKHRTRSMIIVYYDSQVQQAFEDLVKFISASRNAMRKGKMAAKLAKMKRAAELELEVEEEDDGSSHGAFNTLISDPRLTKRSNGLGNQANGAYSNPKALEADDEHAIPQLNFVSARQMAASRNTKGNPKLDTAVGTGTFRSYRRSGENDGPDIFDELDKGLEWSQGQCEHAAHQFLREGECGTEITNIREKLLEVQESAVTNTVKLEREEALSPASREAVQVSPNLQVQPPEISRGGSPHDFDLNGMEVDDEDDEDNEGTQPITLDFKRSRDLVG